MSHRVWQSGGMKEKPVQLETDGAKASGIKLRSDYREEEAFEYWPRPSELQLAELAARSARTPVIDPKQLVSEAWAIYQESCRVIREDHKHVTQFFEAEGTEMPEAEMHPSLSLPVPKSYPVPYKEVERLLLPKLKGRTGDRAQVMRGFLFADYAHSKMEEMQSANGGSIVSPVGDQLKRLQDEFKEEVPEIFAQLRRMKFDQEYFARFAEEFLTWYQQRESFTKSWARSHNARRGWEKRRQEKKAKTGARPKFGILRQIVESAAHPLDGSKGREKA